MLSKKLTISLLSLILAIPGLGFAKRKTSLLKVASPAAHEIKPEPVTIIKRGDSSAMILGGIPMHPKAHRKSFIDKLLVTYVSLILILTDSLN